MTTILVTGGAGFVPSHLVEKLAEDKQTKLVVQDDLSTGSKDYLPVNKNIIFENGDSNSLADLTRLFLKYKIDYVFHYAAVVGVQRTLRHPLLVLRDIQGFENLLELCHQANVKRVYFSSSSEVYGESPDFPQHEEYTPLNSRLPYAIVKNVGEAYLRSYHKQKGLEYTIFRFFNTYGPRQSTDFVMSKFIDAALSGKNITVYGDGEQTRTFCYVKDNIEATTKAFKKNLLINDVANIGSNIEITINELAETILRLTNSKAKIVHLPPLKEGDMSRRLPVVDKMKMLLGREFTPLEDGIKAVIDFRLKNG